MDCVKGLESFCLNVPYEDDHQAKNNDFSVKNNCLNIMHVLFCEVCMSSYNIP